MSDESKDELDLSNPRVLEELRGASGPRRTFEQTHIQVNEFSNSQDFLKKALRFLSDTDDEFALKWATVSLSNALYGFMICALMGSDYHRVLEFPKLTQEQKKQIEDSGEPGTTARHCTERDIRSEIALSGKARLINFGEAMRRIQIKDDMSLMTFSKTVTLSTSEVANITKLRQELRNRFEHFQPTSWAIDRKYFLPLLRDCASCICKVVESGNLYHRDDLARTKLIAEQCCSLIEMHEKLIDSVRP